MRRAFLYSIFFLCVVAGFSITAPYSTLWSAFRERNLEPSGQASWQIREREAARAAEEARKAKEEEARIAAEIAAEKEALEQKKWRDEEIARKKEDISTALLRLSEKAQEYKAAIDAAGKTEASIEAILNDNRTNNMQALTQFKNIEDRLGNYLQTTLQQQEMSIAEVMDGAACRRSSNPLKSPFDAPIDTVRYIILCAYEKHKSGADLMTRANLIAYLNRSKDFESRDLNVVPIDLLGLLQAAWLENYNRQRTSDFPTESGAAIRDFMESDAPRFVRNALIDSLSVDEHERLRTKILPELQRYHTLNEQLASVCRDVNQASADVLANADAAEKAQAALAEIDSSTPKVDVASLTKKATADLRHPPACEKG